MDKQGKVTTPPEEITQMYFEFNQFEEMVEVWNDNVSLYGDAMQLVISRHPYSSGYWIEANGKELTDQRDRAFTGEAAKDIIQRIEKEIREAKEEGRTANLIYF